MNISWCPQIDDSKASNTEATALSSSSSSISSVYSTGVREEVLPAAYLFYSLAECTFLPLIILLMAGFPRNTPHTLGFYELFSNDG